MASGLIAATLTWLPSAEADESLRGHTVDSMMERLIPRNQLRSFGPDDYPTFYRWNIPIRLTVISKDEGARITIEREVIGPLLLEFHATTNADAKLVEYQPETNVLLIIGESPRDDFQFYADKIQDVTKDLDAYSELVQDAQPDTTPCYRNWRFIEGTVATAALYAPSPYRDEILSKKCVAVNFGVLIGLLGRPSGGDTITNIHNGNLHFTEGDKAALQVLYDKDIDPSNHLSMEAIETQIEKILSR